MPHPVTKFGIEVASEHRTSQVLIVQRRTLAVRRRVVEIAIRYHVAAPWIAFRERGRAGNRCSAVGPVTCRVHDHASDRVHVQVVVACRDRLEVSADVEPDRRLPVAEQVVGKADTRREVLPFVPRGRSAREEDLRRRVRPTRTADALVGIIRDQRVVAQATLYREPPGCPLVLRIEIRRDEIADVLRVRPAHDRLRQLVRQAVQRPDLHDLSEALIRLGWVAEAALISELHVV